MNMEMAQQLKHQLEMAQPLLQYLRHSQSNNQPWSAPSQGFQGGESGYLHGPRMPYGTQLHGNAHAFGRGHGDSLGGPEQPNPYPQNPYPQNPYPQDPYPYMPNPSQNNLFQGRMAGGPERIDNAAVIEAEVKKRLEAKTTEIELQAIKEKYQQSKEQIERLEAQNGQLKDQLAEKERECTQLNNRNQEITNKREKYHEQAKRKQQASEKEIEQLKQQISDLERQLQQQQHGRPNGANHRQQNDNGARNKRITKAADHSSQKDPKKFKQGNGTAGRVPKSVTAGKVQMLKEVEKLENLTLLDRLIITIAIISKVKDMEEMQDFENTVIVRENTASDEAFDMNLEWGKGEKQSLKKWFKDCWIWEGEKVETKARVMVQISQKCPIEALEKEIMSVLRYHRVFSETPNAKSPNSATFIKMVYLEDQKDAIERVSHFMWRTMRRGGLPHILRGQEYQEIVFPWVIVEFKVDSRQPIKHDGTRVEKGPKSSNKPPYMAWPDYPFKISEILQQLFSCQHWGGKKVCRAGLKENIGRCKCIYKLEVQRKGENISLQQDKIRCTSMPSKNVEGLERVQGFEEVEQWKSPDANNGQPQAIEDMAKEEDSDGDRDDEGDGFSPTTPNDEIGINLN